MEFARTFQNLEACIAYRLATHPHTICRIRGQTRRSVVITAPRRETQQGSWLVGLPNSYTFRLSVSSFSVTFFSELPLYFIVIKDPILDVLGFARLFSEANCLTMFAILGVSEDAKSIAAFLG